MSGSLPLELHIPVIYSQQKAIDVLGHPHKLNTVELQACFEHGAVWLETKGKPRRIYNCNEQVKKGHILHLYCNATTLTLCPYEARLIADMDHFSIWDKPSGMLSQGSKWGDHWTIQQWIQKYYFPDRQNLITHRLDRFTRGLIIVAHDDPINRHFHRMFEHHQIQKTYRAIVTGLIPPSEHIRIDNPVHGRQALTTLKVIQQDRHGNRTLVEIQPQSGRKHQIRIHLAELGFPIVNDRSYGSAPFTGDLQLQACQLAFKHPLTQQLLSYSLPKKDLLHL
ncbi:MAG: RNA pseudouridine synthase [Gammaproteobacteria bacterium]|nr:RNA pseudouridine synthase [Gammaproteobacteria bacterium]